MNEQCSRCLSSMFERVHGACMFCFSREVKSYIVGDGMCYTVALSKSEAESNLFERALTDDIIQELGMPG